MRALRWVALVPLMIAIVFLFFALAWTEWPQLIAGLLFVVVALALWRLLEGSWKMRRS